MTAKAIIRAALVGLALVMAQGLGTASAETLKVLSSATTGALNVPMNRAVVVESDQPFSTASIANPGIADINSLSERTVYVLGKAPGRTTLTLVGPEGGLLTSVEIRVTPDVAEFKERLRQILPNEAIEVRTANDGIVLSGTVSSINALDRALDLAQRYAPDRVSNLMNVGGTQQVMLKVRFAEMTRRVSKELSTEFGLTANLFNGGYGDNLTGDANVGSNNGTGTIGLTLGTSALGLNMTLTALENKGLVRTLAEPNLTALSGQEAKFLAGAEYPVPVADKEGNITIEYKPVGVQLTFTPRVVNGNIINLQLDTAVSTVSSNTAYSSSNLAVKAFDLRSASTTVEMRDGQSFAIAGLLQDDFVDSVAQVPWLGDVPILGSLFRSTDFERKQSELVVIITAHLVTPTHGAALMVPTDRIVPPSEYDLFLNGATESVSLPTQGAAGEVAQQDFGGSYGYVMED
ncbi:MAG: general secretion pathway protein [Rhodobacterales bacterium]|nr:MAG: general secretion pathway protein [Rhodobacterales bacterium]